MIVCMTAISVTTEQTPSAEEGLESWLTALESSSMNFHPRLFRMDSFFENFFFSCQSGSSCRGSEVQSSAVFHMLASLDRTDQNTAGEESVGFYQLVHSASLFKENTARLQIFSLP